MARTTRRTPVVSNIPSNPRYEHLNILDFKGLSISENPLTQDPSSASDLLNLYVDINGVLTTRPRTEKYVSLMPEDATKLINMYPLEDGVLVQGITNDVVSLWIYSEEDEESYKVKIEEITLTDKKLSVFEKDSKIYILAGDKYYYITIEEDEYVLKDVYNDDDTYIPTTHIGYIVPDNQVFNIEENDVLVNDNIVKRPNEPRNILTNKYKEKYFWSADVDYSKILDTDEYTNNYIKDYVELFNREGNTFDMLHSLSDGSIIKHNDSYVYKFKIDGNGDMERELIYESGDQGTIMTISPELGFIVLWGVNDFDDNVLKIYNVLNDEYKEYSFPANMTPTNISSSIRRYNCKINNGGNRLFIEMTSSINNFNDTFGLIINDSNAATWENITEHSTNRRNMFFTNNSFTDILILSNIGLLTEVYKIENVFEDTSKIIMDFITLPYNNSLPINSPRSIIANESLTKLIINNIYTTDISVFNFEDVDNIETKKYFINGVAKDMTFTNGDTKLMVVAMLFPNNGKTINNLLSIDLDNLTGYKLLDYTIINGQGSITSYSDAAIILPNYTGFFINEHDGNWTSKVKNGFIRVEPTDVPEIEVIRVDNAYNPKYNLDNFIRFKNNYWMYGDSNRIYYTNYNDPTYIPENNYNDFGEEFNRITGLNLASYDILLVYKKNRFWIVFEDDNGLLRFNESKADNGNVPIGAQIITPLSESVVHINDEGFYAVRQLENIQSSDRSAINISLQISPKFSREIIDNMISVNYMYWTFFTIPEKNKTKIYVLDDRTGEWYYWEINKKITNMWVADNEMFFSSDDWCIYSLQTSDIRFTVDDLPEDFDDSYELYEYFDDGREVINWKWTSQIMSMKTINYIKQLMTTSFIVADNEDKDSYGLNYKFKVFRKLASETADFTIEDRLDYVANVTKKTHISRFNFLQMELSNIPGSLDHNKLKLIGLAFKYRYLEGSV